mmetsp:Transcript_27007/g.39122  ORF Transcript_27007/g.39122 Transcript_27007/m.39122 type:complete len:90 (-) Transcript_27007:2594-2863(-)|eukprot:7594432-Ditylum_brightwellii.AAC.1
MKLYEEHGANILIEAPGVMNEKDMELIKRLLKDRDLVTSRDKVEDDNFLVTKTRKEKSNQNVIQDTSNGVDESTPGKKNLKFQAITISV